LILDPDVNATALPAFTYRQVTLSVVQADGKPVAGACLYGFCRDLNLVWPRPADDNQWAGVEVWRQSYLGRTDQNGKIEAKIPPGAWSFVAAATLTGASPRALVVWSDFRDPQPGETIRLAPSIQKTWAFCASDGAVMEPKQLFFKPVGLPIWIPVGSNLSEPLWQVQMSAGSLEAWGEADATAAKPGFVLAWGVLGDQTPNGGIRLPGKTALLEFKGGEGHSQLTWSAWHNFGLEGQVGLAKDAKVLISAGDYSLGYRRPVANALMGTFVEEYCTLKASDDRFFNLDTPLDAALDQSLPAPPAKGEDVDDADTSKQIKLYAQLYLMDGNGRLLSELDDASGQPAKFSASVTVAGSRVSAENMPDKTGMEDGGQTLFAATFATAPDVAQAVWDITGPPGVLSGSRFVPAKLVEVSSATFKVAVPDILEAHAENMLAQAEIVARAMAEVTDRTRKVTPTILHVAPGHHGSSAAHNGSAIRIGTKLLFSDSLILRHDFDHELGHNYGFTHGGLHETSNEATRCSGASQISEQPAKWMFIDRMNGIEHKEVSYHNTGLYLYCYAQDGELFLHFISLNEYAIIKALSKDYTLDEVEAAVLDLAMGRDMTEICQAYGFKVTPERVAQAKIAAQPLCQMP